MAVALAEDELVRLFGKGDGTLEQRALKSEVVFVRGQDHLSFENEHARGIRLTAWQALQTFGAERMRDILQYGSAVIAAQKSEPAITLHSRRNDLGLSMEEVAKASDLDKVDVEDAENPQKRSPFSKLMRIAEVLALDELELSVAHGAGGDNQLAVRLREYGQRTLSPNSVIKLTEAAWVILQQLKLVSKESKLKQQFEPSSIYGDAQYLVWQQGYYLAQFTRKKLGLGSEPIESMRALVEETLGIPLVQMDFPLNLAGGTINSNGKRGIAVSLEGYNKNVWVRRSTLAHELGHILWDPDQALKSLRVDEYAIFDEAPFQQPAAGHDPVEARANAFAIEFLAPQVAVSKLFEGAPNKRDGLRLVMETFGISFTAARFQIWNSCDRKFDLAELKTDKGVEPNEVWRAQEGGTTDVFPFKETPLSRRGRFAYYLASAESERKIHESLVASWLRVSVQEYRAKKRNLMGLFRA